MPLLSSDPNLDISWADPPPAQTLTMDDLLQASLSHSLHDPLQDLSQVSLQGHLQDPLQDHSQDLLQNPLPDSTFISAPERPDGLLSGGLEMNYNINQQLGGVWPAPSPPNVASSVPSFNQGGHQSTPQSPPEHPFTHHRLSVMQHPAHGKVAIGKEKDRKPLDPPPIVQLHVDHGPERETFMNSPYSVVMAYLEPDPESNNNNNANRSNSRTTSVAGSLLGTTTSSLHRVKDKDNQNIAIFVFPDMAVKMEGRFRLRFVFMVMREPYSLPGQLDGELLTVAECYSNVFTVHNARSFPGMAESTHLTRTFADQGVRLRLRKDSRQLTTKKYNYNKASRLAGKRSHDGMETSSEDKSTTVQRPQQAIPNSSRTLDSEPQHPHNQGPDSKRQRHASTGHHAFPVSQTVPSHGSYGFPSMRDLPTHSHAFPTHSTPFFTAAGSHDSIYAQPFQPRQSFGSHMSLPQSGPARIDPPQSSFAGDLFDNVANNPHLYPSLPTGVSGHIQPQQQHHSAFGLSSDQQLPSQRSAWITGSGPLNTSNPMDSQAIQTPVSSSNGSPRDMSYTHTASHQPSGYMPQHIGPFDQGIVRNHGVSTPLTSSLPTENTQQHLSNDDDYLSSSRQPL